MSSEKNRNQTAKEALLIKVRELQAANISPADTFIRTLALDLQGRTYTDLGPLRPYEIQERNGVIFWDNTVICVLWTDVFVVINDKTHHRLVKNNPSENFTIFNNKLAEYRKLSKLKYSDVHSS